MRLSHDTGGEKCFHNTIQADDNQGAAQKEPLFTCGGIPYGGDNNLSKRKGKKQESQRRKG